jgi:hypothetical protein
MIGLVLHDWRHEEKERQYGQRRSRDDQTGAIGGRDQFTGTG